MLGKEKEWIGRGKKTLLMLNVILLNYLTCSTEKFLLTNLTCTKVPAYIMSHKQAGDSVAAQVRRHRASPSMLLHFIIQWIWCSNTTLCFLFFIPSGMVEKNSSCGIILLWPSISWSFALEANGGLSCSTGEASPLLVITPLIWCSNTTPCFLFFNARHCREQVEWWDHPLAIDLLVRGDAP